ncbi:heavy-metal-associated domain-containing protein, partial [Mycobacterium celatum]|uniref:heavy-metal-associated domain-containing protein n=1 Tax=Mycobacterium celatum TaxID=28045 RepID=UPI0012EDF094
MRRSMPLRAVAMGFQTLSTTASVGASMVAIPVREAVRAVSGELPGPPLNRHCWRGHNRAWIEVRGLDRPDGDALGLAVLDAITARPGVVAAKLNRPLSRVVVELDGDHVSLRELCRAVDDAETGRADGERPQPLPGDGLL